MIAASSHQQVVDITDVNSARRAFFVLSAFLNMISRPMHPAITISTGKKISTGN